MTEKLIQIKEDNQVEEVSLANAILDQLNKAKQHTEDLLEAIKATINHITVSKDELNSLESASEATRLGYALAINILDKGAISIQMDFDDILKTIKTITPEEGKDHVNDEH